MGKYTVEMCMQTEKDDFFEMTMINMTYNMKHQATYLLYDRFKGARKRVC